MGRLGLTAAGLAALMGVTAAAASVPNVPSRVPKTAPAKSRAHKPPPARRDPRLLRDAVDSGDFDRLAQLFYKSGYSVHDVVDDEGNTPLHRAAELCNLPLPTRLQLIQYFLNMGGSPQRQNKWGDNPLTIARAKCGGPPAVLALLTPTSAAVRAEQGRRAEPWLQRGAQAFNAGSPQQALAAYLEAEAADPTSPTPYNSAAMAYERMGNWEMAVRELQVAAGLGHQVQTFQTNLDYAVQQLREQQTPKGRAQALLQQAEQLRTSGSYQQAIQVYDQARQIDGANATIYNGEGVAYFQLGNYAMAEWAFKMALQLEPDNQTVRNNLQTAQQQMAAANQRAQQLAEQAAQQRAAQLRAAQDRAEQQRRQRNAEFFNTVTQGLALGQQIAEANRPPPRPAPTYSSAPRPYAAPASQIPPYRPVQAAPAASASPHTPNPANNGSGCVRVVANPGNWGSGHWYFKNDCGWPVTVAWDRYTRQAGIGLGGHYPTGMESPPSAYLACKNRPEIGAELYYDRGSPMCIGPAA